MLHMKLTEKINEKFTKIPLKKALKFVIQFKFKTLVIWNPKLQSVSFGVYSTSNFGKKSIETRILPKN